MVLNSLVEENIQGTPELKAPGEVHGLLIVDKPAGWTSHDVVAKLRNTLGVRKVGHAGTLDPDATGLLPICVGKATRIAEYLMDIPKAYRVRLKLGEETDTEDASGRVIKRCELRDIPESDIEAAVKLFQGEVRQVPPMFSAIRKNGRRLYEYARAGEEVFREARTVTIYDIRNLQCELPYVSFDARCSRGTYIRSLCRDIGRELGVGAHLTELRRTESAAFTEKDAHSLSNILEMEREEALSMLVPMDLPLAHFEAVSVRFDRVRKVCHGQALSLGDLFERKAALVMGETLRIYSEKGCFLAIGQAGQSSSGETEIFPRKVFCGA
jgi:tRNA pseudouridine55 synthase